MLVILVKKSLVLVQIFIQPFWTGLGQDAKKMITFVYDPVCVRKKDKMFVLFTLSLIFFFTFDINLFYFEKSPRLGAVV